MVQCYDIFSLAEEETRQSGGSRNRQKRVCFIKVGFNHILNEKLLTVFAVPKMIISLGCVIHKQYSVHPTSLPYFFLYTFEADVVIAI